MSVVRGCSAYSQNKIISFAYFDFWSNILNFRIHHQRNLMTDFIFISFRYDEQKVRRVLTALENRVKIHGKEGKMANPFFVDPNADTCSNTMNIGLRMGQLAQMVQKISKQRVKRMVRLNLRNFSTLALFPPK